MKIGLIIVALLVSIVLLAAIIGWSLPIKHRASRQATFAASPRAVFDALTRIEEFPAWRAKVKSVQPLEELDGAQRYRESGSDGDITYVVEVSEAPRKLVTRIADETLPFGGRWTFDVTPSGAGTTLVITEDGEVYNPIFRFMSRFVFGHTATLDTYLADLRRKLGEPNPG